MKTVIIVAFTDLSVDPRVNRQIRFLREHYRVIAAGTRDPAIPGVDFVRLIDRDRTPGARLAAARLLLGQYEEFYWNQPHIIHARRALKGISGDLVIANDIETLPVALKTASGARVVLDAHEYAPREREEQLAFRLVLRGYFTYLCRRYIPAVDAMITVSAGIAAEFERDTGVRPVVIHNAPDFEPLEPSPVSGEKIRLVHHGGAYRERKIESLIDTMRHVDERFELSFMLVDRPGGYLSFLRRYAADLPAVRFLEPVPMRMLPRALNPFDVGVYILEPSNLNNRLALPNKLFEFIQARLGIAIAPSPEMAAIVRAHGCGVVAGDFTPESLARSLKYLDRAAIARYKEGSHRVAQQLSAEHSRQTLLTLSRRVLGN